MSCATTLHYYASNCLSALSVNITQLSGQVSESPADIVSLGVSVFLYIHVCLRVYVCVCVC